MQTFLFDALLAAALAVGQAPEPNRRPAPAPQPQNISLDGTWNVVAFERDGKAVPGAQAMTVSIRNNVVTFAGRDVNERAIRMVFGPQNTVRVVAADEGRDGKPADRDPPEKAPAKRDPASGAKEAFGPMTGVYVLAQDFFALTLLDQPEPSARATEPARRDPSTGAKERDKPDTPVEIAADATKGALGGPSGNAKLVVILRKGGAKEAK